MTLKHFERDCELRRLYAEAHGRDEKHSAAVRETVQRYRQSVPGARVSETTVKRALAKYQPKGARTILTVGDPAAPSQELQDRYREVCKDTDILKHKLLGLPMPAPDAVERQITKVFDLCVGPRPDYPRHNRKTPKVKRLR